MTVYPKSDGEAIIVLYDLRDPGAWQSARDQRQEWGPSRSRIHSLDVDHVVVEFLAGGAQPESGASA